MKTIKLLVAFIIGLTAILLAGISLWYTAPLTLPLKIEYTAIQNTRFFLICGLYILAWLIAIMVYLFRDKIIKRISKIPSLKSYLFIAPYAKPYWVRTILAVVITIPVGAMDAVIAWSLKPFMDVVLIEKQTGWTMYIPLMIIAFSILQALFTYIATYLNTWVGNRIALDLKRKLFDKLLHCDASFFDKNESGFVLYRFNNDADSACGGLLNSMRLFSTRFFSSLSLLIVLFYNSWKLAVVATIVLFGALLPLTKVKKRVTSAVNADTNMMMEMLKNYNEAFSGNRIITSYNLFRYFKNKFNDNINAMFNMMLNITKKIGVVSPIMHVVASFGIAFVIWYGSYLIVSHQITVGNFASFITSLVMLYNPLKSIGNSVSGIVISLMAAERVSQIFDMKKDIADAPDAAKLADCRGEICYKDVSFAYNKDTPVLKHINLEIKPGQTVALVGNSGGGKSTISVLLPRFYDVSSGAVTVDGKDIRKIKLENLRDNISIVFQDNFLFGGTIRENILLGRTDVSKKQLNEVIKAACLDEFIDSLDDGLDTEIGERGVLVSGGQKQRIAIARAFVKNAPILILDEATSALDNKSEKIVQQAIDNLMKNRTVLVIAHRLSTVRNADYIAVINNGEVVERGPHEELLAKDGEYAALYKTQLS